MTIRAELLMLHCIRDVKGDQYKAEFKDRDAEIGFTLKADVANEEVYRKLCDCFYRCRKNTIVWYNEAGYIFWATEGG